MQIRKPLIPRKKNILSMLGINLMLLLFFAAFFLYQGQILDGRSLLSIIANALFFAVFAISVFHMKAGLYTFMFLVPLLNSLPQILDQPREPVILLAAFGLFLGFLVNNIRTQKQSWQGYRFTYGLDIAQPVLAFIAVILVSSFLIIYRHANFYPFMTNHYYNLMVNAQELSATGSMFITLDYFFNYFTAFLVLFVIFNTISSKKDILASFLVLLGAALVAILVTFYQYFADPLFGNTESWAAANRFNATFTDPNALGAYAVLLFPVFVAFLIFIKKIYFKIPFLVLTLMFVAMVLFSGSRAAFLGIFLSVTVLAVLFVLERKETLKALVKNLNLFKKVVALVLVVVILAGIGTAAFVVLNLERVEGTFVSDIGLVRSLNASYQMARRVYRDHGITEALKSISNYRYIYWEKAGQMFSDHPVAGVGLGGYIIELPNYFMKHKIGYYVVDTTGNYYLQILAELGLTGLILILFVFYKMFARAAAFLRVNRKSLFKGGNVLFVGLFAGFLAMVFSLFFGPHTNVMEIQFMFWIIIGLMLAFIKIRDQRVRKAEQKKPPILVHSSRIRFGRMQKIGFAAVLVIFSANLLAASLTDLSIHVKQNRYGFENAYGLYEVRKEGVIEYRWTYIDSSQKIRNEGSTLVLPVRAANPDIEQNSVGVKVFIDNYPVANFRLENHDWHRVVTEVPSSGTWITLTVVVDRGWRLSDFDQGDDDRIRGIALGRALFID